MDSSRSGLLSTLMMTLPLIVVPAIALLRPPGQLNGVSTAALDASESAAEDAFLNETLDRLGAEFGDSVESSVKPARKKGTDDVDSFIENELKDASATEAGSERRREPERAGLPRIDGDPFMPEADAVDSFGESRTTPGDSEDDPARSAEKIVEELSAQGALRTLWFEAGARSPVGFAAFFRGQAELFRFEAVGQTRDECAQNVLDQVTQWQVEQDAARLNGRSVQ